MVFKRQTIWWAWFLGAVLMVVAGCKSTGESDLSETVGGNNVDPNARLERLAVFDGETDVSYCVNSGQDSSVSVAEARPMIDASFQLWSDYLAEHRVNETLIALGGKALPTRYHFVSVCDDGAVVFHLGSPAGDTFLEENLLRPRDSLISAIFNRSTSRGKRPVVWIAGRNPAPQPATNPFDESLVNTIRDRDEMEASLRYLIGRLLGNVRTPGGIMHMLPEELLACYRAGEARCVSRVKTPSVDDDHQLVTRDANGHGVFAGCFLGMGPVVLRLEADSYHIGPAPSVWSAAWRSSQRECVQQSSDPVEVFAEPGAPRLFFEQTTLAGFANRVVGGQSLTVYERVRFNTNHVRASVSLLCGDKETVLFVAKEGSCESSWDQWKPGLLDAVMTKFAAECK